MAFNYSAFKMADLMPLFEVMPQDNYLLQTLNIFDKVGSKSIDVSLDTMAQDNRTLINDPQKRFSFSHNSTARDKASNYLIELVHFHREDVVSAADFQQGNRKAGADREETMMDIVSEYVAKHAKAHRRTVEAAYARALFTGTVNTPFTDEAPVIDYAQSFDAPFMTDTLDLTTAAKDVLEIFDSYLSRVSDATQGLYSDVRRVIVFAGADAFSKLRFHESMKSAFQYVSPLADGNIITQRRELLPNVQTFTIPGIAVDVVKVTDPLLTPFIGRNEMIMLPVFTAGTGAYKHVFGPASVDTNLARLAGPQEVFSYQYEKPRGEIEIVSEAGILPVNHATAFTLKVTATV
ncbi:major capsid protein [Pantoea sp. UBA5035]|uniref:major capsid protein n=1 Tax=Pantoea sp. UBA5035 TaxID=1947035 RepID=UPI00257BEA30|nr:major capsid protein [Pantoea sp. UBA5035]